MKKPGAMKTFVPADVMLDTNALSDVTNGRAEVVARFYRYLRDHERIPVPSPVLFEMVEGLTRKPKPTRSNALRNLRSVLDVRPLDEAAAELAGEIAGTLHRAGKNRWPDGPADRRDRRRSRPHPRDVRPRRLRADPHGRAGPPPRKLAGLTPPPHTVQSATACVSPATGSPAGMNSWAK